MSALPLVALVGRPNVGKSTLFNRLVGKRMALTHDEPGVTRDRRYAEADWAGKSFRLVDTGGFDAIVREGVMVDVRRQARRALEESDLVLFVLDALEGPTPSDREVASELRRLGKPVFVLANKVDSREAEAAAASAYELGFPDVFAVSGAQGRGVGELLDAVVARTGATAASEAEQGEAPSPLRLAFLGKPNAGKSSLVNRILGEERVVVHDQPGTTRDPIDTPFVYEGRPFVLIDTAGIRRKKLSYDTTERVAVQMAVRQVERADVVALVIDGVEGPSEQDARLAGMVEENGRALMVVVTKMDLLGKTEAEALRARIARELEHVSFAPVLYVSSVAGHHVPRLLGGAMRAYGSFTHRVPTGELNRFFDEISAHHPPPHYKGRPVRIYYITQAEIAPPTFVLQANYPEAVAFAYRRYLVNQLRERFGFEGTPVRLVCRRRQRQRRKESS